MSNIKLNVQRDANGVVALYKNNKAVTSVEIKKDVDMEIDVGDGFGAAARVSAFSLFTNVNGAKGAGIGTWTRQAPTVQPSTEIAIAANGDAGVKVTDTDTTVDEELFFFSVQVTDGAAVYDTDPELKVKKKS